MEKYYIEDAFEHEFWIDPISKKVIVNSIGMYEPLELDSLAEAKDYMLGVWDGSYSDAQDAIEDTIEDAIEDTIEDAMQK